jgi:hypothetical protein
MYYKGKSKEEAYKEMKYYGFKDDWTLRGLKSYFEKHSQQPVSQYLPHCPEHLAQTASDREETTESREIDLEYLPDFAEPCRQKTREIAATKGDDNG